MVPSNTATAASRQVLFLTGTRADFGKMKPLIRSVQAAPGLEASIFATGMHMLERYGSTVREIRKAGFDNVFPFINQDASVHSQMDLVLGNTIQGLGHYVRECRPDLLVVHGDRIEALAGAIVGSLNNILVAHVEGGEVSGTIDELIRHSVSKLAHVHFVSNPVAERRLIQMGEEPSAIYVIGSPDIDIMLSDALPPLAEVKAHYDIGFDDYAVLLYHPVTTSLAGLRQGVREVLTAAVASQICFVVIYPNNDSGSEIVLEEIRAHLVSPRFRILPSMRFEAYLTLLRHARFILGNSSSGIHEAPVYGVPTLNVGTRQRNRFQHESILPLEENAQAILAAIARLPRRYPPTHFFGDGNSASRFMAVLRDPAFWDRPRQKQFVDVPIESERSPQPLRSLSS